MGWFTQKAWFAKHIKNKTIFRYSVYKKMFTPYEVEQAYEDTTEFDSFLYHFGIIKEVIELSGDLLIGFQDIDMDTFKRRYEDSGHIKYHKLSDIKLTIFACDKEAKEWSDEGDE